MKNIWLLTKTNIKRNKMAVLLSVSGAFALCFILYAMGNMITDATLSKIKIGYMDHDKSLLSEDFEKYLSVELDYELVENNSYEVLSTELIDKNISAIIEIPEGFYDQFSMGEYKEIIMTTLDDFENAAFLQAYLNSYMGSIKVLSDSAGGNSLVFDQLLADYNKENVTIHQTAAMVTDRKEMTDQLGFINSIGFFLMFIFGFSVIISFMILDDRLSGVYNRIQVTPVKPIQYISGTTIFGIIMCAIEIIIYCTYIAVKGLEIGFPVWVLVVFMSLFSLFTVCFSISVALAFKSKNAITSIVIGFSTIGCILGGAYFPLELAPESLQNLSRILPQFWFMDTFRALQENAQAAILPNLIIMILFTVLALLVGAVLFSQNYKKS
ncbi:MAG: type transporter [Herbinix sp.]|jgi:ABC-2 type transport system permease protein|nr:type transporter [Herbinix sp.]